MRCPSVRRLHRSTPGLAVLALVSLAASVPGAQAPDPAPSGRVRLDITHAGVTTLEAPALCITALDAAAWGRCPVAAADHDLDASWAGVWPQDLQATSLFSRVLPSQPQLPRPVDSVPTSILVSGAGELRPREVIRSGNRFTITCDGIIAGGGDATGDVCALPTAHRELVALSLGLLPAGRYECTLAITWRTATAQSACVMQVSRVAGGSLGFVVADHRVSAVDSGRAPEVLTDAQLTTPAGAVLAAPPWVSPRLYRRLLTCPAASGLWEVAAIDAARLGGDVVAPPAQGVDQPGGAMSAVIIGPLLNSGETLTLREVTVEQGAYRLRLETWSDDRPRLRNVPHQTLLVVPLPYVPGAPRPEVVLDWHELHADASGGCYRDRGFGRNLPIAASHLMIYRDPIVLMPVSPPTPAPSAPAPADAHPRPASSGF